MKKLILLAVLAIAANQAIQAQGFRLGAKAGANLTKIDGMSFKDGYKLGYQVGAFAEIDFSKRLGIQPELLFSQTNTQFSDDADDIYNNAFQGDVKLNYLNIPILLRINTGKLLTLHVGPQFSVLVDDNKNLVENGRQAFKGGDFSMIGGLQLNLSALRIYGRYNIGLSNINDIDNQDKWKNQQIQLGVGLRLL